MLYFAILCSEIHLFLQKLRIHLERLYILTAKQLVEHNNERLVSDGREERGAKQRKIVETVR